MHDMNSVAGCCWMTVKLDALERYLIATMRCSPFTADSMHMCQEPVELLQLKLSGNHLDVLGTLKQKVHLE